MCTITIHYNETYFLPDTLFTTKKTIKKRIIFIILFKNLPIFQLSFGRYNILTIVVIAIWANSMWKLRLVTLWTDRESRCCHLHVWWSSFVSSSLRSFSLRYCHFLHLLFAHLLWYVQQLLDYTRSCAACQLIIYKATNYLQSL